MAEAVVYCALFLLIWSGGCESESLKAKRIELQREQVALERERIAAQRSAVTTR